MLNLRHFYIGGRWTPAHSGREQVLIDPSTEEPYGTLALADETGVDDAVAAARAAFPAWANTEPAQRMRLVERMREISLERSEEMARAISQEMGAPIDLARQSQAMAGPRHMSNYLAAMDGFSFLQPLGPHAPQDRIALEPIGVAALITPWNWPISQIALKVIAALLAGCTLVLKPSEIAPLSANLFAEIMDSAGLPPGVFNLVHGDGEGAGQRLATHPDIDMVSFTGSTRAGIAISQAAAPSLKRVSLELGGKGANLVFADADDMAVERGVRHCFMNSGQSCNAPTRMLVERSIYDRAVDVARRVAQSVAVGPASAEGPHIGPVAFARQFDRVQELIHAGMEEASLIAGGPGRPPGV
ncbi:MAG: aldehyde dehydrogenase family protein [Devosia sp.]|nr:aldehyde dehydrogenase family protein [Devosia sp.]